MKKSHFLQRILVGIVAFLMIFAPVNTTFAAVSQSTLRYNYANDIMFYEKDDCTPSSNISAGSAYNPSEGGWYWNGECVGISATIEQNLERDYVAIKAAARQAGVPWELIPAQAMNESGWKSDLYNKCNNPLGIKGSSCGNGYARYDSVQDAYYAYTQTAVVKDVISTGLYADKPYSFLEYMQYGGKYSYAVCEPGYSFCVGVPDGTPTPHYVNSVSKNVCGIQKWAESKGYEISSETYANFVDPKIDSRIGGVNDGLVATGTSYCKRSTGDWGEGGMRIANVAVELAWPNQEDDTCGLSREYQGWSVNSGVKSACSKIAKPQFTEAKATTGDTYWDDTDCGHFVNVTIRYSGVDQTLTPYQVSWMGGIYKNAQSSPLWEEVTDIVDRNSANLLPGDVFHSHGCGHTFIYVGDIPSKTYGNVVAQASQGGHTGDLRGGVVFTRNVREGEYKTGCVGDSYYHIYRFIGDGVQVDDKKEEGNE